MNRLAIEINAHHVRLYENKDGVEKEFNHSFSDFQDHRYTEQLDSLLENSGLKNRSFDSILLSWSGFRSTLIPSNIFEEGQVTNFFELCFGTVKNGSHVAFDRLQEYGMVNIYEFPDWMNTYFSSRFPRILFRQEGSHLIQKILSERYAEMQIIISIHQGYFLLIIAKEDKLLFYSPFDYQEPDDIVYHVMFTLQQKELLNEGGNMTIYSGNELSEHIETDIEKRFKNIRELGSVSVEKDQKLVLNSIELCAL